MIATVVSKKEVAKGTLQVELKPAEPMDFLPGQYVDLILIDPPYQDARGPKRHFSIINSPNHKETIMFTTRLRDSAFKKTIQEMPIGGQIEIHHIGGKFILPEDTAKNYVFIAGGIGITPFMNMIRTIQENNLPHKVTLIYSNRNQESTPFLEELRELENKLPKFKLILTMTEDPNWVREKNKVDANFIKKYLKEPNSYIYYMAGPPPMVEAVTEELKKAGVETQYIITENFTGY